jgi:hypothetical protein
MKIPGFTAASLLSELRAESYAFRIIYRSKEEHTSSGAHKQSLYHVAMARRKPIPPIRNPVDCYINCSNAGLNDAFCAKACGVD